MLISIVLIVAVLTVLGVSVWNDSPDEQPESPDPTRTAPTPTPTANAVTAAPERADSVPARWADGDVHGRWAVLYTGYGEVEGHDHEMVLQPRAAAAPGITHSALVHTSHECLDADFALTVRTESQVRRGTPNPWEVGWVLWNFHDDDHFYAVVLKPNGWEISKQDPDFPGSQRFIATGTQPQFPVGTEYRVAIAQDWPRMTVTVDGHELATVIDEETPYRGGAVGLYTEDARVRFSNFDLPDCRGP